MEPGPKNEEKQNEEKPGPKNEEKKNEEKKNEEKTGPKNEEKSISVRSQEENKISDEKLQSGATCSGNKDNDACNSCAVFEISSNASHFCFDCLELLCKPCSVGRHSSKSARNHKLIDLDVKNEDSNKDLDLQEIQQLKECLFCDIHPDCLIDSYCKEHKCCLCGDCTVMRHRMCDGVVKLEDSAMENDARKEIEQMQDYIEKCSSFAISIRDARNENIEKNKSRTEVITKTLQELRTKINNMFDALGDKAKYINETVITKGEKEKKAILSVMSELKVCLSLIQKATKHIPAKYLHPVLQNLMKKVNQYETTALDIRDSFAFDTPELKINSMLQNMHDTKDYDTRKLCDVVETSEKANIQYFKECDLLRSYIVTKTTEKEVIENYNGIDSPTYSDLVFLPNNFAAFVDRCNGYVCLTNKSYEVISSIKLSTKDHNDYANFPTSCTLIRGDKIAVSAPSQYAIYLLTADKQLAFARRINTRHKPRAIYGLETGELAVAWEEPAAFGIISDAETPTEKRYFCEDNKGRRLHSFQYIAVDETREHVIQSCQMDNAVYCFSFEGDPKFKYANSGLTYPKGVALDRDGNIYVCSSQSASLHIVSPTGLGIRIIKDGCPSWPLAIAFKTNGKECAVTQESEYRKVSFFQLHRQE